MQIKIGEIYKVKPEFRGECATFKSCTNAKYIRYIQDHFRPIVSYEILDENKNRIDFCSLCLEPEHLEPIEKTLYNLEINDLVVDSDGNKRKVLGLIESSLENPIYVIATPNYENVWNTISTKQLETYGYKVVQPELTEEIKEMTVEEVSKLVGKKVKIVE